MLAGARLDEEIAGGKLALETLVGAPVASLADPHAWHDRASRTAVISAGYRSAAAGG